MFHFLRREASHEVLHDVDNKFSTHAAKKLLVCFHFCRVHRYQHRLIARGFPPLSLRVPFAQGGNS